MNRYIPDDTVEDIRSRCDIIEVLQSYLPLRRAGTRFKALCPFHDEKTPSFVISPERQSYHCFGCGRGGDVFRFIMDREGVDFPGAVHLLAMRCGVDIPEPEEAKRDPEARHEHKIRRERLYKMHEEVAAWYAGLLQNYPDTAVAGYLRTRNLDSQTISRFRLGAAPDAWDEALRRCRSQGYSEEELLAAGIILRNEESGNIYDRFRNRLVFPIWDEQGRVVAFSARTIEGDSQGAKYVNSPETPIFRKSRVLYALPLARESIRDQGAVILCEGQLDVIAMHRAGYSYAVAPQGTAFTDDQARILRRYTERVLLAFDSDSAGIKASMKALELLLTQGFHVQVVSFPEGEDPDSLFAAGGANAVIDIVNRAQDFFDFLFQYAVSAFGRDTPWERKQVCDLILKYLGQLESQVLRVDYAGRLANLLNLPEQAVFTDLNRQRRSSRQYVPSQDSECKAPPAVGTGVLSCKAEETLLELALMHGTVGCRLAEDLEPEMISDSPVGKALNKVISMTINGEWESAPKSLAAGLSENPDTVISRILTEPVFSGLDGDSQEDHEKRDKAMSDAIRQIRSRVIQNKIDAIQQQLRNLQIMPGQAKQEDERVDSTELLRRLQALKKEQMALS